MTDWRAEHDAELSLRREWSARAQKAEAEIERLQAALRPFAEFAETVQQFVDARAKDGGSPVMPTNNFRLADFRRAAEALKQRNADSH